VKKFYIYLITVVVFFVIGVVITNFVIMPSVVHLGKEVTVPNVCNLPLEDAIQELKKHNLEGIVTERRHDRIINEGKILIHDPLPGAKVKVGRMISLSVSLGPESVKIPYLTGIDIEKGKLIIKNLGLVIERIDSSFSDSLTKGKIIRTIPEFETEVKKGDAIRVVVSKGIVLRMPNLLGIKLSKAKGVLRNMGLIIGEIKEVEASGTRGNIIIQHPEPEHIVHLGDTINVMVIK